ncbi:MAG: hypothetical protein Q9175_008144 [Cornicularia normoerica]
MVAIPKTLNDLRIHKARAKGDFTGLEEYNAMSTKANAVHQLHPGPEISNLDVESGRAPTSVRAKQCDPNPLPKRQASNSVEFERDGVGFYKKRCDEEEKEEDTSKYS